MQTFKALSIDKMKLGDNECIFYFTKLLKTSRPGNHQCTLVIKSFMQSVPIQVLHEYLKRTKNLRGSDSQLLISCKKPHKAVTTDTLSRWLKEVLKLAGTDKFTGHSTRAASSSAAKRFNVDIATILQAAGWTSALTFNKFHNKPLQTKSSFGEALLDSSLKPNL